MREEFEAIDAPDFDARGTVTDEYVRAFVELWTKDAPTFDGKHVKFSNIGFDPKPVQKPHPPIVVTAVAPFSKGVTEAAARGWDPISANFLMPEWVKSHWPKYVEGCERVGRKATAWERAPISAPLSNLSSGERRQPHPRTPCPGRGAPDTEVPSPDPTWYLEASNQETLALQS